MRVMTLSRPFTRLYRIEVVKDQAPVMNSKENAHAEQNQMSGEDPDPELSQA